MTEVIRKKRSYKGSANPSWKGGRVLKDGYWMIYKPDHPFCNSHRYVAEHRLRMEEYLGRYLRPEEQIHHLDMNTGNNRIGNLMMFANRAEHLIYERTLDLFNRYCLRCKSKETYIAKSGRFIWLKYKNGHICTKCYDKMRSKKRKS